VVVGAVVFASSSIPLSTCSAQEQPSKLASVEASPKRVLVIFSDERLLPANVILDEAMRTRFAAALGSGVDCFSEFLDISRFGGNAQEDRVRDFLRDKYSAMPPDLVITVGRPALTFVMRYRGNLFTKVPVLFCGLTGSEMPARIDDPLIVGIPSTPDFTHTMELILRLHPQTREIALIAGVSPSDVTCAQAARDELRAFEDRVKLRWLTNRSLADLQAELSQLPDGTIVLYTTLFQDQTGQVYAPREALARFSLRSRVPIYGVYDTYIGYGVVGGSVIPFETIGNKTAEVGLRILSGQDPQSAARGQGYDGTFMFDSRQLKRFGISEARLPAGSIVRFKEYSIWERYWRAILIATAICIAQTLLIVSLFIQLRRRRRADERRQLSEAQALLAADEARKSEARFKLVVESSPNAIVMSDQHGKIMLVNSQTERLFRYGQEELIGQSIEVLIPEWFRESLGFDRAAMMVKRTASSGRPVPDVVARRKDGTELPVEINFTPIHNEAGTFVLCAIVDLSARRYSEAEITQLRENLSHIGRVSAMGQLASALAHEINQPLGAILRNAEAAQLLLETDLPDLDELRAIIADIRADDHRAGNVIDRLRGLMKRREIDMSALNLRTVLDDAASLTRAYAVAHQVRLEVMLAPDLPKVRGDLVHLQQVVLNLLLNAMDSVNSSERARRVVSVGARPQGNECVEVFVIDRGNGISREHLSQIFDPFFTTKSNGLGMGLAISRTIVEAHGGRLSAENNMDENGATFRFTLRVAEGAAPCSSPDTEPAPAAKNHAC
jgi:PAS domain S-box-containing protein